MTKARALEDPVRIRGRGTRGEIDAWVSSAPYLGPALAEGGLRSLIGCDKVIPNRSVFWLHKDVAAMGKPVVEVVARSLAETDRWIAADPERAGHLFFKAIGGVSAQDWARSVATRTWGLSRRTARFWTSSRPRQICLPVTDCWRERSILPMHR